MEPKPVLVKSASHLRLLIESGNTEYYILGNNLKSCKLITYYDQKFSILHELDGFEETLTSQQLEQSNIGQAILFGQFYMQK